MGPGTFKSKLDRLTADTASTSATSGLSHNGSMGIEETQYSVNSIFDKKDSI